MTDSSLTSEEFRQWLDDFYERIKGKAGEEPKTFKSMTSDSAGLTFGSNVNLADFFPKKKDYRDKNE